MTKVFIAGGEGTTGLRLAERLGKRRDVQLLNIDEALRKDTGELLRKMVQADFCFFCLPDSAALELAELAKELPCRIIDASTAHRVSDGWDYGFPELSRAYREAIAASRRVANPGCHASGFLALTRPLVDAGLLAPGAVLSCTSLTGYSGGGKRMIAQYEAQERALELDSSFLYALGQSHKHLPEMAKHSGLTAAPVFLPVVGDYYAGMAVSVPLSSAQLTATIEINDLRGVFRKHYSDGGLVRVIDEEPGALYANSMSGRDDMRIYVTGGDSRFVLTALFDNLGKGASGSAIQCFNIMNGLADETGLCV
ncbi:MAG: N-acetyl-gamma-glutamyl-phosphate reductase [Oscillospiraceae bacterium]|jgi:N-acetyl-gamma-glutamyl-phosphate reductase|nr:N-acetyl-gamma-glutamyl-phosphate reductase [Oscillospiraceae bacterium]